ncbi:oligopeptide/dipeptide ABC transporter ATP-binding protein [Pseudomonas sp. RIT-PI-AD]|uniref:ABC transporter ATP-binding protein n=1 Tax=Pseudomonas sp. RIT-PI-AD TaxID=3035294 RepID=UPI0021DB6800|nr:oligopeptide/dipeptide ABC transporter ATP-binding protein [Pseudomonas sp. RIT-PI-AD]
MSAPESGSLGVVVKNLRKHYVSGGGWFGRDKQVVRAIADVSLTVPKGVSVGLVGESGCGKSTVARAVLRLVEPDDGTIFHDGVDVRALTGKALREHRRNAQLVFQDPFASLNPKRTIWQTLEEPLRVHRMGSADEIRRRVERAILEVGLPVECLSRYAHEFSGGQRQRIGIARALILEPDFIVADEPVSALDVSVQAQILQLLLRIKEARGLSFLFVSHDLGVVRYFCALTNVMYLGRIVEYGPTREVMDDPRHPYTRLLRDSSPIPDPAQRISLVSSAQELPSAANPPPGCAFHPRCPRAEARCRREVPLLRSVDGGAGRTVACHFPL